MKLKTALWILGWGLCWLALPARAVYYVNAPVAFSWVNPSTHTNVAWAASGGCDTIGDDSVTALLNLGFTFNYGGTSYTQVRIMSNGRLQFNNTFCGAGTNVVTPRTYTLPYPDANLPRTMRIYGADLDASLNGSGSGPGPTTCPVASCYVRYATLGTAPNRSFVVTWVNVPDWGATGSSFNLQVILYETGEFDYQFGASNNTTGGKAQIGWEVSTTDFDLVTFTNIGALANTAVRFAPTPVADYRMEQATWVGTSSVIDSSGNARHGTPVGGAQTVAGGKVCRGGNIPSNTSAATIDAVGTGLDVDTQIGSTGAISFWYKSNSSWNGGTSSDAQLFDATTANNRWFYLVKQQGNGRLFFNVTDNANNLFVAQTANNTIAANIWTHIAVTWKFTTVAANNRIQIYVNGALAQSTTVGTTSPLSASIGTLYLGDNRSGLVANPGTGNSANGVIDEVRIYNYEIDTATVNRDMAVANTCVPPLDHFFISHSGTGITCEAEPVTITGHDASHNLVTLTNTTTMALSTSTNRGDWSLTSGGGTLINGGGGAGSYTFAAGGESSVVLALKDTFAETTNINVAAGLITERTGTASADVPFDADLSFVQSGFRFIDNANVENIGTQIAGKNSSVAPGAQSLFLQAVRTDTNTGACVGVFGVGQTVTVDLASECIDPVTCAGRQFTINGTSIANNNNNFIAGAGSYSGVALTFNNSSAPIVLNYPDVGRTQLHARYNIPLGSGPGSGNLMLGSSNLFVVKPFSFFLSGIKRTSDNFANPGAANATGPVFIKAGDDFSATVTATTIDGATPTPNYGREVSPEGVTLNSALMLPGGGVNPTVSNGLIGGTEFGTGGAVNDPGGVATVTNLNWGEVGIITLTQSVSDSDYLGVGNVLGVTTGNIGRFTPHHFALSAPVLINRSDFTCAPVSNFTYMSEPFNLSFTLTAQNLANATTQNYMTANSFAKLDGTSAANWMAFGSNGSVGLGAIDNPAAPLPANRIPLSNRLSVGAVPAAPTGAWTLGIAVFDAHVSLNRSSVLDGPFDLLNVGIAPQDADSVRLLPVALNLDADNSGSSERAKTESTIARYGRLKLSNAYGSELLDLPIRIESQFWNGSVFATNTLDNCTVLNANNIALGNYKNGLNATNMGAGHVIPGGAFVSGRGNLKLTKPLPAAAGSVDIAVNLGTVSPDQSCLAWSPSVPSSTGATMPYLRGKWCGPNYDRDPSGRTAFGIYKNANEIIYMREMY